jgi:hypothetical protein
MLCAEIVSYVQADVQRVLTKHQLSRLNPQDLPHKRLAGDFSLTTDFNRVDIRDTRNYLS